MTGIILQARMGSTRLPGKVLKGLCGSTLLERIFERLGSLRHRATLVVATTLNERDDVIERLCSSKKIDCFRGSEEDVLERYYLCAKKYGFTDIVRLTADNPFVDVEELDNLIDLHERTRADYTHSFGVLPVGAGAEAFTFAALERSFREGKKPNHREHVNEYIQENPGLFSIEVLSVPEAKNRPDVRLTVDTPEDFERARRIIEAAGPSVTTQKAIELCTRSA